MWTPERVVATLRSRGELWESVPGLIGLRGDAFSLYTQLERGIARLARNGTGEEWRVPEGLAWATLEQAEYFASFPQWLTAASHLPGDPEVLERIAAAGSPADPARAAMEQPPAALSPAACYHTYAALAGTVVGSPSRITAQATCWRHEGERLRPLERGWAFTMREMVCLGTEAETEAFRQDGIGIARALATGLGLEASLEAASDPFFAPASRGRALLQRIKALKHELVLSLGSGRGVAAASFNHHEHFFGHAFDIRLADGGPAASACVAFGIERWLLAFLVAHGPDAARWPCVDDALNVDTGA